MLAPPRLGRRLLQSAQAFHRSHDRPGQLSSVQSGQTQQEELDVLPEHVVVEGDVGGVVAVLHAVLNVRGQPRRPLVRPRHLADARERGEPLWPPAVGDAAGILRREHEADGPLQRRLEPRVPPFDVEPQDELRRRRGARVVEGRVAVVVLELLQAPAVGADGRIPFAQRVLAGEIVDVVPPARRMLGLDERQPGAFRGPVERLVVGGVVRVEHAVPDRGSAGRLDPAHGAAGFHLAPGHRQIRQVVPHIAAPVGNLLVEEHRGPAHGRGDGGRARRAGRTRGAEPHPGDRRQHR